MFRMLIYNASLNSILAHALPVKTPMVCLKVLSSGGFFFLTTITIFWIIKSPNESLLPQEALSKHQPHPYIFPIKQNMSAKHRTLAINNN